MAIRQRFAVEHRDVFPAGVFLKGPVSPVWDFERSTKDARVQAVDVNKAGEGTGLLLWEATFVDGDADASKAETAIKVKFAAKVQPVPPENKTPFPFTPVEFVGLTALPYIDDTGQRVENGQLRGRARIVWSYRATGMCEPGKAATVKDHVVKDAA
jgi:hypothetical protein